MEQIVAKPTTYNGYLFRSKLEAKWAVFFDRLGVSYQYEPEAFLCKDGSQYTPDFYLPDSYLRSSNRKGLYLEIKPFEFTDNKYEKRISSAFGKRSNLCLFVGDPYDSVCTEYGCPEHDRNHELRPNFDNYMMLFYCEKCRILKAEFSEGNYMYCPLCDGRRGSEAISRAATDARQYRFQYLNE